MKNIPERIFLNISKVDTERFSDFGELVVSGENAVTWCHDKVNETDVEYVKKQSPWINVKERLPEVDTGVFFTVECKDLHKGYFVGVYYGNGHWESEHRIFLPDSSLGYITHWMPIPKFNEE